MSTYNIKFDLDDQKRGYLSAFLLITMFGAIPLFGLNLGFQNGVPAHWLILAAVWIVSYVLYQKEKTNIASWVFLLGGLLSSAAMLWFSGPNITVYLLMMLPLVLSMILMNQTGVIKLAFITGLTLFITTWAQPAQHLSLFETLNFVAIPVIFCGVLAAVVFISIYNTNTTVYWATDIQQKDTKRAEMFYEQREQLSEALRQLTHAHSRLKTMNGELEIAKLKTDQASQAKSVFLSNMSHELRTPLNVIIGYTSTMLDMPQMYSNVPLPPNYRADVQLIKDNGYYLLGLINDILDLSKIEAGKLELNRTTVKLGDVLRGTMATAIGLIKDKPVQLRPEFSDDLPAVFADSTRVRQIILNLMSNAIKFTHSGSVTLRATRNGDFVTIAVIDTGIGIPEKALPHIFDRFEQAERDTDKHYGGTGLGLDISKQLVKMHGGEIKVESVVGQGSTFSFTLPVSKEPAIASDRPEEPTAVRTFVSSHSDLVPNTILLVEDEASLREMFRRSLEDIGQVVVDIQDGAQVLETALGLLPDLIILDICLPNLNGWDVLQALKANDETTNIPIIVCTASDDSQRAADLGAAIYLQKPFSSDELCACVQELLLKPVDTDQGV